MMIQPGARVRLLHQISFGPGGRMNEKFWISAGTEGEVIARTHSGVYWMVRFGTRTGSCRPEELELLDVPCDEEAEATS